MQESNLKVSKQENSACDSNIIEGELSHLVFDVENPATEHRQQHPLDECGDGGGGEESTSSPSHRQSSPARPALEREDHLPRGVVHEAPAGLVLGQALCVVALPADGVVDALLAIVAQLVQLDVVLDEGVGEQAEHQQHERLRRAVQHSAEAPRHHHDHLLARGEAELNGGRDAKWRLETARLRRRLRGDKNVCFVCLFVCFYQLEEANSDGRLLCLSLTSVGREKAGLCEQKGRGPRAVLLCTPVLTSPCPWRLT